MGQRPSATRTRLARWLARPGGIATCFALPPLFALSAFLALFLYVMHAHEHTHTSGAAQLQAWLAVERLREDALASNGHFPAPSADIDLLIESERQRPADPCLGALRYEWLDEHGTRARIVALGEDGAPGGSGCDEDVVLWFDVETAHVSLDARESPDEWR